MAAAALTVGATATTAAATAATLQGAGSTLVAPLATEWANGFQSATGNVVNYSGVGSGAGITDITNRIVDFGASDAPMTPTQAAACNSCVTIPWALSATGIGYNLPGLGNGVKLTGKILASIYLGRITNWSDPAIKKINQGVNLPNRAITPVFRSDGSGDTYAFTNYLALVSPAWGANNYATTVSFGRGVGAKGNAGVAAAVQNTTGAIGYISASYLIAQKITTAKIQNARGNYEYPGLSNIANAAGTVHSVPAGNVLHIVDPPRSQKKAYPISTFTYAIVPSAPKQPDLLKAFLTYAVTTGRTFGIGIDFAPIPSVVKAAALSAISTL